MQLWTSGCTWTCRNTVYFISYWYLLYIVMLCIKVLLKLFWFDCPFHMLHHIYSGFDSDAVRFHQFHRFLTLWHYPRTITTLLCFHCVIIILNSHVFLLRILYCFPKTKIHYIGYNLLKILYKYYSVSLFCNSDLQYDNNFLHHTWHHDPIIRVQTPGHVPKKTRWFFWVNPP